jgi:hypothetical protein
MVCSLYSTNRPLKSPQIQNSNHEPVLYHAYIKVHEYLNVLPIKIR